MSDTDKEILEMVGCDPKVLDLAKDFCWRIEYNLPPVGQGFSMDTERPWDEQQPAYRLALVRTLNNWVKRGFLVLPE